MEDRILLNAADNERYVAGLDALFRNQGIDPLSQLLISALNQGAAPWQVAEVVENTPEAHLQLIQQSFLKVLHHPAESADRSAWLSYLGAGGTSEGLEVGLLSSSEYFEDHGGAFLSSLFEDTLHQALPPLVQGLFGPLMNNELVRLFTADIVVTSPEARLIEVDQDYQQVLGSPPDLFDNIFWLTAFADGASSDQVLAGIAGLPEAFLRLETLAEQPPTLVPSNPAPGAPTNPPTNPPPNPPTNPPTAPVVMIATPSGGQTVAGNITVSGQVSDANSSVATLQAQTDSGAFVNVPFDASGAFSFATSLPLDGSANGPHTVTLNATNQAGQAGTKSVSFTLDTHSAVAAAPTVDPTVATTLAAATQFLYTGSNPIQQGVAAGTINPLQTAVLVGEVQARDGTPLAGVTVTVLNHPEFGSTQTALDGSFQMAVNGGGQLTVNYAKDGYVSVQRQVQTPWQDYAYLPTVVLIPEDTQVTAVNLSGGSSLQVAQGSSETDSDGTRQATLMFAPGTTATMTLPDGSTQPLSTLHVRATEFTVGPNGPDAMPGTLPPTTGYTYAVDYSVDEAQAAGATAVTFSQPVIAYVQNFLNFPVGMAVPSGYYDHSQGVWVPSDNGLVVKVLSITNGMADLDVDGSGNPADATALTALGITDAERQQLATLYQPGQTLWRVPIQHFSNWDYNWGYGPPPDAVGPGGSPSGGPGSGPPNGPQAGPGDGPGPGPGPDCQDPNGSTIGIEHQSLGESVNVAGTPFTLNYQSDRTPGDVAASSRTIQLSGASIPASLERIDLEVDVAGRTFQSSFAAAPNESTVFTWDGKDIDGRELQGTQLVTVRIGYVYPGSYQTPAQLAKNFGGYVHGLPITGSVSRQEITFWQTYQTTVTRWDAQAQGLGGWNLSVQNGYDPVGHVLYLGNGSSESAEALGTSVMSTAFASNGAGEVAVGPDGSLYFSCTDGNGGPTNRVLRVSPDGVITTVAGTAVGGFSGDGGPATEANLDNPFDIVVGPDGSLYIADSGNHRIRRVSPDGIITTVAGNGSPNGDSGDGGPATEAGISDTERIAVGPDGSLYIADTISNRIRRVSPDGIITTVAGTGVYGFSGDGGPATDAELSFPNSVAVGPDGSLYIGDREDRIQRVSPDGIITTVAGSGTTGFSGDGGPATEASLNIPGSVAVGPDGSVYFSDALNYRIRQVSPDGVITTVAGTGVYGFSGDGGPATDAELAYANHIAVAPDGSVYFSDPYSSIGVTTRIRHISPTLPGVPLSDFLIPSEDGSEVYRFNGSGRQLSTLDALTGATLYQFGYDSADRLITVTDGNGNVTTIQRDASGNPTAIVAPGGQTTTLTVNADGYISSISDPGGNTTVLTYGNGGLLSTFTDPNDNVHSFTYDALGRLTKDADPAGGSSTLNRTDTADGYIVTDTSALGQTETHELDFLPTGEIKHIDTDADGSRSEDDTFADGSETITYPDGTVVALQKGPDPRWGMLAPVITSETETTPGGLTQTLTNNVTATLNDPTKPFSLQTLTDTFTVNGQAYKGVFDAATDTITNTSPGNLQTVTKVNAQDQVIEEQTPGIDPLLFTYDAQGRLTSLSQGTGTSARTFNLSYNSDNTLKTLTDALGNAVTFGYDAAGNISQEILPDGQTIAASYDANGNLASLTPPGRPATTFTSTSLDQTASITAPNVGSGTSQTLYDYNKDRQLSQITLPTGQTIGLGYDGDGNLSTVTLPTGQLTNTYDPTTGNLTNIAAPGGIGLAYTYDGSLLTGTTWSGPVAGSVTRTYTNNFLTSSLSVDGGTPIAFQYNADNALTGAGALTLTYNPQNGALTGTTLGDVTDAITYDEFGEPSSYTASVSGTAVYAVQYTCDQLGRITQKVETIGGTMDTYAYSYDQDGRLTQVQKDGSVIDAYTYDSNGNRLTETTPGGTATGTYNNQDQLLTYGGTSYQYDANGTLTSKTVAGQTTTYQYDDLGDLLHVTLSDDTKIDYLVDGEGRRIGKEVNGVLVQGFLYQDGLSPVAELDGNGNVVATFVYASGSNKPDFMIKGGVTYRIISDQDGSPRLVINTANGQIVQRMDYDAFGNVILDTNPGFQPFGFAGGLYDADTGLVHFGARDYDPQTGRWTAKDPIGFAGGDTNLYEYVGNDPVNFRDGTGLDPIPPGVRDVVTVLQILINIFGHSPRPLTYPKNGAPNEPPNQSTGPGPGPGPGEPPPPPGPRPNSCEPEPQSTPEPTPQPTPTPGTTPPPEPPIEPPPNSLQQGIQEILQMLEDIDLPSPLILLQPPNPDEA